MPQGTIGIQWKDYGYASIRKNFVESIKLANNQGSAFSRMNKHIQESGYWNDNLRNRSIGLRREVSKLRNDLLLLSFSLGLVKTTIIDSIADSEKYKNSLLGLAAVARTTGNSINETNKAAQELTNDGLLNLADASAGLKNLMATKFDLPEAIKIMKAFKDAAAFNRQGTLQFGEAIVRATEGVKNQISALVDNVGITKNLSVIMREAGFEMEDLSDKIKGTAARQALLNGLMQEAALFQGNATTLANQYSGAQSRLNNVLFESKALFGSILTLSGPIPGLFTEITKSALANTQIFKDLTEKYKSFIAAKIHETFKNLADIFEKVKGPLLFLIEKFAKFFDILINTPIGQFFLYLKLGTKILSTFKPYVDEIIGSFIKLYEVIASKNFGVLLSRQFNEMAASATIGGENFFTGVQVQLSKAKNLIMDFKSGFSSLAKESNELTKQNVLANRENANTIGLISKQEEKLKGLQKQYNKQASELKKVTKEQVKQNGELGRNSSLVRTHISRLGGYGKVLSNNKKQLEELNASIEANNERIAANGNKLAGITAKREALNASIRTNRKNLSDLNLVYATVAEKTTKVNHGTTLLGKIWHKVTGQVERVSRNSVKSVDDLNSAMGRLHKNGVITRKEYDNFKGSFDKLRQSAIAYEKQVVEVGGTIDKTGKVHLTALQQMKIAWNILRANILSAKGVMLAFKTAATAAGAAVKSIFGGVIIGAAISLIIDWIYSLTQASSKLTEQLVELSEGYKDLQESISNTTQELSVTNSEYNQFLDKIGRVFVEVGNTSDRLDKFNAIIEESAKYGSDFQRELQEILVQFKNAPEKVDEYTQSVNGLKEAFKELSFVEASKKLYELESKLQNLNSISQTADLFSGQDISQTESYRRAIELQNKLLANGKDLNSTTKDRIALELKIRDINEDPAKVLKNTEALANLKIKERLLLSSQSKLLKDQVDLYSDLDEKESEVLKNYVNIKTELNAVTQAIVKLRNASQGVDLTNILATGTIEESAKKLFNGLTPITDAIEKLKSLKDSKNVKLDIFGTGDIITPKDFESVEKFKTAITTQFRDLKDEILYVSDTGSRVVFKDIDELTTYINKTNKIMAGSFATTKEEFSGTAKEVREKLISFLGDLPKDDRTKYGISLEYKESSAKEVEDKIDAFLRRLEKRKVKADIPQLELFGKLNEEIGVFSTELLQIISQDENTTTQAYKKKIKQAQKFINDIKALEATDITNTLIKESAANSKSLEQQVKAIRYVKDGYYDLKGEAISFYQEVGEKALELANIEKARFDKVLELSNNILAARTLENPEEKKKLIEQLLLEIERTNKLAEAKTNLLHTQEKLAVRLALDEARYAAIANKPMDLGEDLIGFSPEKQKIELAKFYNDKINAERKFRDDLSALVENKLIEQNDANAMMRDFELAKDQEFYNKKYEMAKASVQALIDVQNFLLEHTLFASNRENLMLKASSEAQQQILRDSYNRKTISKKDYEEQSMKLAKSTALQERIAAKQRALAVQQEVVDVLKTKAKLWLAEGLAAAATPGGGASAAKFFAAAALAGAAAVAIGNSISKQEAALEKSKLVDQSRIDNSRGFGSASQTNNGQAMTVGGTITAQEYNVTIAPSISISGDTVILGNMGIAELEYSIGQASVNAVKSAVENNEINIAKLQSGNVGG